MPTVPTPVPHPPWCHYPHHDPVNHAGRLLHLAGRGRVAILMYLHGTIEAPNIGVDITGPITNPVELTVLQAAELADAVNSLLRQAGGAA